MRHGSSAHRRSVLAGRAAEMRAAPTSTEALLWSRLSGSQLGVGFRRQLVIGDFIADFAAPSRRLVVEVDGGYHARRADADARRDRALGRLGWRVVRVPAGLVARDVDAAVAIVVAALADGVGAHRAEPSRDGVSRGWRSGGARWVAAFSRVRVSELSQRGASVGVGNRWTWERKLSRPG